MSGWSDYGWPNIFFSCDLYNPVCGILQAFQERLDIVREVSGYSGADIVIPPFMGTERQSDIDTSYSKVYNGYYKAKYYCFFDRQGEQSYYVYHRNCMKKANEILEEFGLPRDYYESLMQSSTDGVPIIGPCVPNESAFVAFYWYYVANYLRYVILNHEMYNVTVHMTRYDLNTKLRAEHEQEGVDVEGTYYFNRNGAWDKSLKWWSQYIKENYTSAETREVNVVPYHSYYYGYDKNIFYSMPDLRVSFGLEKYPDSRYHTGMVKMNAYLVEINGIFFDNDKSIIRDTTLTLNGKKYLCASRANGKLPIASIEHSDEVVPLGEINNWPEGHQDSYINHSVFFQYENMNYDIYRRDFLEFKDSCVTDEDPVIPEGTLIEIVNN